MTETKITIRCDFCKTTIPKTGEAILVERQEGISQMWHEFRVSITFRTGHHNAFNEREADLCGGCRKALMARSAPRNGRPA